MRVPWPGKALAEIRDAEDRARAGKAIREFAAAYGARYPKAVAKITDDSISCWRSTASRPSTGRIPLGYRK
jgi:hypothetical protein